MSTVKKLSLCLVPVVVLALFPVLLSAQDAMSKQDNMGNNMGKSMSATGCLKQGSDANGFYLTSEDGKTYELWGKGLSAHVNHKVTVTGHEEKMPESMEQKRESAEKQEAGNASVVDMKVTHVKMISENCQ
ncbi:MAG TPA: hypothetical protein VFB04_02030 [Terriglobales bacterium]|nr:hypothetical protein [Terriglobales bacterium]